MVSQLSRWWPHPGTCRWCRPLAVHCREAFTGPFSYIQWCGRSWQSAASESAAQPGCMCLEIWQESPWLQEHVSLPDDSGTTFNLEPHRHLWGDGLSWRCSSASCGVVGASGCGLQRRGWDSEGGRGQCLQSGPSLPSTASQKLTVGTWVWKQSFQETYLYYFLTW